MRSLFSSKSPHKVSLQKLHPPLNACAAFIAAGPYLKFLFNDVSALFLHNTTAVIQEFTAFRQLSVGG